MKKLNPALDVTRYGLLAVLFLFLLFPVYWMVITALKTNMEAYLYPPTFFPQLLSIDSFKSLFNENRQFFVYYGNNFVVSAWSAALTALLAIPAGYGLSRFKFKWNIWIIALFLSWQMFPVVSRMISLYGLLGKIHLINTMPGLILALVAGQIPFCVILMAGFFDAVPKAIEDAALVDGAGRFKTLYRIVVPLVVPGILAVAIYSFLMTWDDYLHAATLIQNDALRTLSVGIALRYLGELSYDWSLVNAISVVGALPLIVLFIFFQKYMVRGLVAGAVKG